MTTKRGKIVPSSAEKITGTPWSITDLYVMKLGSAYQPAPWNTTYTGSMVPGTTKGSRRYGRKIVYAQKIHDLFGILSLTPNKH